MLQIAAFLRMQADGYVPVPEHVRKEAAELLQKVGEELVAETETPQEIG